MGLFEKQIPKYVRTPEEDVVVEPVVVDDIFDPILNAEVRARLAAEYGNSPLATFAGYNELLNNIWTENDGTFGKGMGLLSAFGRSMEKADDLILGTATELVEGISGQGFDNPIENIFVNDEDYTGRRFLAAAANTMRGFADGTTVTEEDFGPAWGLPSLGIELISDVGILGSSVAKTFTPELMEQGARRVPSNEILRNLGTSGNAKTTIGEVGRLLSDYDDLMTNVAIDITAPGLRPAFKSLLNRLGQMIGAASYRNYENVQMNRPPNEGAPQDTMLDDLTTLYREAKAVYDTIPETVEDVVARESRTAAEVSEEVLDSPIVQTDAMLENEAAQTFAERAAEISKMIMDSKAPQVISENTPPEVMEEVAQELVRRKYSVVRKQTPIEDPIAPDPHFRQLTTVENPFEEHHGMVTLTPENYQQVMEFREQEARRAAQYSPERFAATHVKQGMHILDAIDAGTAESQQVATAIDSLTSAAATAPEITATIMDVVRDVVISLVNEGVDDTVAAKMGLWVQNQLQKGKMPSQKQLERRLAHYTSKPDDLRQMYSPAAIAGAETALEKLNSGAITVDDGSAPEMSEAEVRRAIRQSLGDGKSLADAMARDLLPSFESISQARREYDTAFIEAFTSAKQAAADMGFPVDDFAMRVEDMDADLKVIIDTLDEFRQGDSSYNITPRKGLGHVIKSLKPNLKRIQEKFNDPIFARQVLGDQFDESREIVTQLLGRDPDFGYNFDSVDDFEDLLANLERLYNREFEFATPITALEGASGFRDRVHYARANPRWHLSTSDRSFISQSEFSDKIRDAMQSAYTFVNALRNPMYRGSVTELADSPKSFEKFLNSDRMTTVLFNMFGHKGSRDVIGRTPSSLKETQIADRKIAEFKKLLKQLAFLDKEKTTSFYALFGAINEFVEFMDDVDLANVNPQILSKLEAQLPEEFHYIMYVDAIADYLGTELVSRIKGFGEWSYSTEYALEQVSQGLPDAQRTFYTKVPKRTVSNYTPAGRGLRETYRHPPEHLDPIYDNVSSNVSQEVKLFLSALERKGVSYEQLQYILSSAPENGPSLMNFVQVAVNSDVDLRGTREYEIAQSFLTDVVPVLRKYMDAGGNPFNSRFKPYDVPEDLYNTVMDYLGFEKPVTKLEKSPHPNSYFFRKMAEDLIGNRSPSDAPLSTFFKGQKMATIQFLRNSDFPMTPQPMSHIPLRLIRFKQGKPVTETLSVDTPDVFKVVAPSEFSKELAPLRAYMDKEVSELDLPYNVFDEAFKAAHARISKAQAKLGLDDEKLSHALRLLQKGETEGMPDALKFNLHAYWQEYIAAISNLPYHVVLPGGDRFAKDPTNVIYGLIESTKPTKRYGETKERFAKRVQTWKEDVEYVKALVDATYETVGTRTVLRDKVPFNEELLNRVKKIYNKLPIQVRDLWKPDTRHGLFHLDVERSDVPYVVTLGEALPLYEYDSQIFDRHANSTAMTLLAGFEHPLAYGKGAKRKEFGRYLGYMDYRKLTSDTYANDLARIAMGINLGMPYFEDSKVSKKGISEYFANLRLRRNAKLKKKARRGLAFTPHEPKVHVEETPEDVSTFVETVGEPPFEPTAIVQETSSAVEEVATTISEQPVEEIVEQLEIPEAASNASQIANTFVDEMCPNIDSAMRAGASYAQAKSAVPKAEWDLYTQIEKARACREWNASGDYATGRSKKALELARDFRAFLTKKRKQPLKPRTYYTLMAMRTGDVVPGNMFWKELREAGQLTTPRYKGDPSIRRLKETFQHNANVLNGILGGEYFEVIVHNTIYRDTAAREALLKKYKQDPKEVVNVTIRFKGGKLDVIDKIKQNMSKLDAAKFEDVVFLAPQKLSEAETEFLARPEYVQLSQYEAKAQALIQEYYRMLGFNFDGESYYSRHSMNHNDSISTFLYDNFYAQVHSDTLDDIVDHLATLYNSRGAFGTKLFGRRFRGPYWLLEDGSPNLFSYDPLQRFKNGLTSGALANNQFQTYVDLFHNGNFEIREYFRNIDDLKKVLYAVGPDGKSGNFNNLELVSFKLNEQGRVVGLHRFDKASDKGLEAALADPDTILVPTTAVAHIDKIFKQERRMSNKTWVFFNKYFTMPFKLGVLMNPGFLVGNLSDATAKTLTALAEKYNTSIAAEAAYFASSLKACFALKNNFYSAYELFLKAAKEAEVLVSPSELIPEIAELSPKHRKTFEAWLSDELETTVDAKMFYGIKEGEEYTGPERVTFTVPCSLTEVAKSKVRFWLQLQSSQMDTSKTREFAELAGIVKKSPYDRNKGWTRVLEGSGAYDPKDPKTWGLLSNPYVKLMMDTSENMESVVRVAMMYNDLAHQGKVPTDTLPLSGVSGIDFENAMNTMYSAHFDYENTPEFMDDISDAIPFPIFFLKNFYFWMELFMNHPQFVDNVIDIQEGLWAHREEEDENDEFAKSAKGRGAIPLDLTEVFKGFYKPSPLQSMFSAFSLLNDPVGDLQYRLHPAFTGAAAVAHQVKPTDLTTLLDPEENLKYRPYSFDPYEKNVKPGDDEYNPLKFAVHRANPMEKAVQSHMRVPKKVFQGNVQFADFFPSMVQPEY